MLASFSDAARAAPTRANARGTGKIPHLGVMPFTSHESGSDVSLLERIVARDEGAVGELYDKYARLVFSLLLRILRDRNEAEEVLQEVFLAAWSRADSYNAALGTPAAWLVGIARNRAIDRLRSSAVRIRAVEAVDEPPPVENPESRALSSERRRSVAAALDSLPLNQRQLIECAYFEGLTHSELAERFQVPLGTVKTRVRTGMQTLRALLQHAMME